MICSHCKSDNPGGARFCSRCGVILGDAQLAAGFRLDHDRYEVKKLIKSGGMGAVYLVRDSRLGRDCALKEMVDFSPTPGEREKAVERFHNEVALLSSLSHPSLPQVSNFFAESGHYYMVMDYIDGEDMEYILREDGEPGLSERFVTHMGIEICRILEYLHQHSPPVVNRDIKPSNIMIGRKDNRVYLIDFGIARAVMPSSYRKTAIGTEGYAPLEQYRGFPEPRSDIYALGATMYHLLSGGDVGALDFAPIRTIVPSVSESLEAVLGCALSLYPEGRFRNAMSMREELEKCMRGGQSPPHRKEFPPHSEHRIDAESPPDSAEDAPRQRNAPPKFFAVPSAAANVSARRYPDRLTMRDGMEMCLIDTGRVMMGTAFDDPFSKDASQDEMPAHIVEVPAFYMDMHPVTNAHFSHFVEETGYSTTAELRQDLRTWRTCFRPGRDLHPVVYVSWFDAGEYASWAGKRLPTELEWERAARGADGRHWPWGADARTDCVNCREAGIETTSEVLRFPEGRSPFGVYDMAGNVREWTGDWYRPYPYAGPYSTGYLKSIRGSSFSDRLIDSRCSRRWENAPAHRDMMKGFRCAVSILP